MIRASIFELRKELMQLNPENIEFLYEAGFACKIVSILEKIIQEIERLDKRIDYVDD